MSRCRSRIFLGLAALAFGGGGAVAEDWKPPEAATSRRAFEAQYPRQSASAAALEIEELSSSIGIDAAQDSRAESCDKAERMAPSERTRTALSAWVTRELESPGEAISAPPSSTVRFMEENDAAVAAIVSAAAGRREIVWDLDVGEGTDSPVPNWVGLTSVQRVLAARALLDLRRKDEASALDAIEAIWRIAGSLAERPELLSHSPRSRRRDWPSVCSGRSSPPPTAGRPDFAKASSSRHFSPPSRTTPGPPRRIRPARSRSRPSRASTVASRTASSRKAPAPGRRTICSTRGKWPSAGSRTPSR